MKLLILLTDETAPKTNLSPLPVAVNLLSTVSADVTWATLEFVVANRSCSPPPTRAHLN